MYRWEILRDASNELLNSHKILIDSKCNYGYPISYWKVKAKYKKMIHSCTISPVSWFSDTANCFFAHNTTHESCTKVTMLFYGWCKVISSKYECQILCFPCVFRILHNLFQYSTSDVIDKDSSSNFHNPFETSFHPSNWIWHGICTKTPIIEIKRPKSRCCLQNLDYARKI